MKQRLLFLVVLLAFMAGGAALAWRRQAPALPRTYQPQGPGDVYLALGDSLATGVRLVEPQRESYVALLGAQLKAKGVSNQINLGVAGATSDSLLRRQIPRALELITQAQREGQRVSPITIDIGGNDLRSVEQAGEAERAALVQQVGRNLAEAIAALQNASHKSDIALMTYYDPFAGDPAIAGSDSYWVERLNTEIRRQAAAHGVAIAEVYSAFGGGRAYEYTNVLLGDIHANSRGHAIIADQFWQALRYK